MLSIAGIFLLFNILPLSFFPLLLFLPFPIFLLWLCLGWSTCSTRFLASWKQKLMDPIDSCDPSDWNNALHTTDMHNSEFISKKILQFKNLQIKKVWKQLIQIFFWLLKLFFFILYKFAFIIQDKWKCCYILLLISLPSCGYKNFLWLSKKIMWKIEKKIPSSQDCIVSKKIKPIRSWLTEVLN